MTKEHFNSVDAARSKEDLIVFIFLAKHQHLTGLGRFDVGGNKYRVVCGINFTSSTAFIKRIMTHDEYTQWNKQGRPL